MVCTVGSSFVAVIVSPPEEACLCGQSWFDRQESVARPKAERCVPTRTPLLPSFQQHENMIHTRDRHTTVSATNSCAECYYNVEIIGLEPGVAKSAVRRFSCRIIDEEWLLVYASSIEGMRYGLVA